MRELNTPALFEYQFPVAQCRSLGSGTATWLERGS